MADSKIADNEYQEWITSISRDFRRCQLKAALKVNDEMLRFYWRLGKDISERMAENKYGSGFYNTLGRDLQSELPDVKSFSATNLKYMKYFYELYPDAAANHPQLGDDLQKPNRPQLGDDLQKPNRPQLGDDSGI